MLAKSSRLLPANATASLRDLINTSGPSLTREQAEKEMKKRGLTFHASVFYRLRNETFGKGKSANGKNGAPADKKNGKPMIASVRANSVGDDLNGLKEVARLSRSLGGTTRHKELLDCLVEIGQGF